MSDELIERVAVRIVRAVVGHSAPISGARVAAHNLHAAGLLATRELLAHVDHLTAENARLRSGIEAFATDAVSFGDHAPRCSDRNCLHDYSIRNQRRAADLLREEP